MKVAEQVGPALMDGKSVGLLDRLHYGLANLLVYGPLRNTLGPVAGAVAYTAGEAIGPDLFTQLLPLARHQPQAALRFDRDRGLRLPAARPRGARADTVGVPCEGVEIRLSDSGEILVKSPGLLKEYYKNERPRARC